MDSSEDESFDPCLALLTKPLGAKPLRKYKPPVSSFQKWRESQKKLVDDKFMNPPPMTPDDYVCLGRKDSNMEASHSKSTSASKTKHSSRSRTPVENHNFKDTLKWWDQYKREEALLYQSQKGPRTRIDQDNYTQAGSLSGIETNTFFDSTTFSQGNGIRNVTLNSKYKTVSNGSIRDPYENNLMKKFNFNTKLGNNNLPICRDRDKITDMITYNQVTIIRGYTGCGKSTQVPQFILDYHAERNKPVNIIVTQPRKIAAQSIARRVCNERNWSLGALVGYMVGLDKECKSNDTRLLFCTTGILKKMLISRKDANEWTHIILDEVHEREEDMDFLLMLLRRLVNTNSQNVRLVLMSATIDLNSFKDYFSLGNITNPPQIFELHDTNPFEVEQHFLETIQSNKSIKESFKDWSSLYKSFDSAAPILSEEVISLAAMCIIKFDDYEKTQKLVEKSAVLVFLPGEGEIMQVKREFERHQRNDWLILPLHSKIPWEETKSVFTKYGAEYRKIILSTNIAESSITIPDVDYVIDFCLTKLVMADQETNYFSLKLSWTDRNSCEQRKGRAGRLRQGKCFRMVPREFYDKKLPPHGIPEILRAPLDKVILDVKILDFGPPVEILALTMAPPKKDNIMKNIMQLKEIGAILPTVSRKPGLEINLEDGDLTILGKLAAFLPVDIRLGKLIILGHLFGVLEECVIIAAGLSNKSIFSSPFNNQLEAFSDKIYWSNGSSSDCMSVLIAYNTWQKKRLDKDFERARLIDSRKCEETWCRNANLQIKHLREMKLIVDEITKALKERCKIETLSLPNRADRNKSKGSYSGNNYLLTEDRHMRIMSVIFGAFYPNYFLRSHIGRDQKELSKALNGRDPAITLYLTGFPQSQMENCFLYEDQLKGIFKGTRCNPDNMEIEFVGGQSASGEGFNKVLISFLSESPDLAMELEALGDENTMGICRPDIISPYVYIGLKLRSLPKEFLRLNLFDNQDAIQRKKTLRKRLLKEQEFQATSAKKIGIVDPPPPERKMVGFAVSHVTTPSSFWVNYLPDDDEKDQALELNRTLKDVLRQLSFNGSGKMNVDNPRVSHVYLAPYFSGGYYRARIEQKNEKLKTVVAFFIDYGNVRAGIKYEDLVDCSYLKTMSESRGPLLLNAPALALECCLARIKPNPLRVLTAGSTWDDEVTNRFNEILRAQIPPAFDLQPGAENKPEIYAEIYSVIPRHGKNGPLLSVIIFPTNSDALKAKDQTMPLDSTLATSGLGDVSHAGGFPFWESINYQLVQEIDEKGRNLAIISDEKHASQISHEDRIRIQEESIYGPDKSLSTDMDDTTDNRPKQAKEHEIGDRLLDKWFHGNEDSKSLTTIKTSDERLQAQLRGPNHPLEITLQCVHRMGRTKNIKIESDSVNSILLDRSLPGEIHDVWCVAHEVSMNPTSTNLQLRSTNMMPNRAGLGHILAMAFAPFVELRVNPETNGYTGCLLGMGSRDRIIEHNINDTNDLQDRRKVPYYPSHDTELSFDVEITNDDIEKINKLRYVISHALSVPFIDDNQQSQQNIAMHRPHKNQMARLQIRKHLIEDQDQIHDLLDQLLNNCARQPRLKESYIHAYHWIEPPPKGFSEWKTPLIQNEHELIYKMIPYTVRIEPKTPLEENATIYKTISEGEDTIVRLKRFHRLADSMTLDDTQETQEFTCPICPGDMKCSSKNLHQHLKIGGRHEQIALKNEWNQRRKDVSAIFK